MPQFVLLWTDAALWALAAALALYVRHAARTPPLRAVWARVMRDASALSALVVCVLFALVALVDSVHFRRALPPAPGAAPDAPVFHATTTESLLDLLLARPIAMRETSYSRPLATHGLAKETVEVDGRTERVRPRLEHGGRHLADPERDWAGDVARRAAAGAGGALALTLAASWLVAALRARRHAQTAAAAWRDIVRGHSDVPWRAALLTLAAIGLVAGPVAALAGHYHPFGTDRTGNSVLVQALQSIRTAFVIGSLATVATLPLAVGLGVAAGYLRGWVDEVIQYVYTVLSSVPNVLLIAACVLMAQVFIDQHAELFETGAERADLKLLLLCLILGLTGWAGLARLIRAETLKLRELEYVQAAQAFGVGPARIMRRHLVPNVAHLVLISTVLDFSALVLYEAVLSYVGVGVDPGMASFGGMINQARGEMSRDPVVWWSFATAFVLMVVLVLAVNLLADGVRDAFDPRGRVYRPRLRRARA